MKIRTNFVSNSSSASFIVHTNLTIKELRDVSNELFSREWFEKRLAHHLSEARKDVEFWSKKKSGDKAYMMRKDWLKRSKDYVTNLKIIQQQVKDSNDNEVFDLILKFEGQKLEKNQLGNACFKGHTSMYNDDSDIGEFLVEVTKKLEEKYGENSSMITWESDY